MNKPILKIMGKDGNAFAILGAARKVAIANNMNWEEIQKKATAGTYANLLNIMMEYFDVQ